MQISKETLLLIKNFSTINGSIVLKQGKRLSTISAGKNIFAEVTVEDEFPCDFPIYDLQEFLNVVSLFATPNLDFNDKYVIVSDGGKSRIKYYSAGDGIVKPAPNSIKFSNVIAEFELTTAQSSTILKTASVLKTSDVSIIGDGNTVKVVVGDRQNDTANEFELDLCETSAVFSADLKVENIKMVHGDFKVQISDKRLIRFTDKASDLTYTVTLEASSKV